MKKRKRENYQTPINKNKQSKISATTTNYTSNFNEKLLSSNEFEKNNVKIYRKEISTLFPSNIRND